MMITSNKTTGFTLDRLMRNFALGLLLIGMSVANYSSAAENSDWVTTWTSSPSHPPIVKQRHPGFENVTIRQIVHITLGGDQVRVRFSNADGTSPLKIGSAHIAIRDKDSAIVPDSDRVLTFAGSPSVTIPVGAPMLSDPVNLDVALLSDLAISVYLPEATGAPTMHGTALQTNYVSPSGDFSQSISIENPKKKANWFFLTAVEVHNTDALGTIVAVGDSITDGSASSTNLNRRWPDYLARRLAAHPTLKNMAVANAGIGGNRVLNDTPPSISAFGRNLLSRLEQDVLSRTGITHIIVLEGINDIGFSEKLAGDQDISADELIQGYRQVIARGHMRGIKVIGATLPPFKGADYFSKKGEKKRLAINEWIRTSGEYDGWIDFEAAVRDPENPNQIRSGLSPDNLHPNDEGYKAMADIIDLSLFED